MPHKSKISSERKIEVVESYLRGKMGATQIIQELDSSSQELEV